jgi:2-polyprenyl-3-methyl-5-hydroxy-6-metoxy-1,4-benzoquinol methylase
MISTDYTLNQRSGNLAIVTQKIFQEAVKKIEKTVEVETYTDIFAFSNQSVFKIDFLKRGFKSVLRNEPSMSDSTELIANSGKNEFNPKEYWESRISTHGIYNSIGRIGLSEKVNEKRKTRVCQDLETVLDQRDINLTGKKVLDAGCGTGIYSKFYAERGSDVSGVDFSHSAIEKIQSENISGKFQVGDISSLNFGSNEFDIVHCFSVLYHIISDNEWEEAISELCRVLKPNGILLLRIAWFPDDWSPVEHVQFRSKQKYTQELSEHGIYDLNTHSITDSLRFPMISKRVPGLLSSNLFWKKNSDQKIVIGQKKSN